MSVLRGFYATVPLWVLLAIYWCFSIQAHLNIGHRHILPTYPPTYILAGAVGWIIWAKVKWPRVLVGVLLAALAIESLWIWPHYLAYFNQLIGGPKQGYTKLVDSSLDWGQDLPSLKRWLDQNAPKNEKVYLSYFGNNEVKHYGINNVTRIAGCPDWGRTGVETQLRGGIYCISATALQTILIPPWGPWQRHYENRYQQISKAMPRLLAAWKDPQASQKIADELRGDSPSQVMKLFDQLRFARLAAYLRQREPDDWVGYSILIYKLTDAEVQRAVKGPPPELKPTPDTGR